MSSEKVAILLATYNGCGFLDAQLQSIVAQTHREWELLIRDDGSTDATPQILQAWAMRDSRIKILTDSEGNLGIVKNYGRLMQEALERGFRYFALSDQDDIWDEGKIEQQLLHLQRIEVQLPGKPILVHTDLVVADKSLQKISSSFMEYQRIRHESENPLAVLLTQNFVTGCTILGNRALLEVALPIPVESVMHDWWLALCAGSMGRIAFLPMPLVYYRQHGSNVVGAKSIGSFLKASPSIIWRQWRQGQRNLFLAFAQAEALYHLLRKKDPGNANICKVALFASLKHEGLSERLKKLWRSKVHCQHPFRSLLLWLRMLSFPSTHEHMSLPSTSKKSERR